MKWQRNKTKDKVEAGKGLVLEMSEDKQKFARAFVLNFLKKVKNPKSILDLIRNEYIHGYDETWVKAALFDHLANYEKLLKAIATNETYRPDESSKSSLAVKKAKEDIIRKRSSSSSSSSSSSTASSSSLTNLQKEYAADFVSTFSKKMIVFNALQTLRNNYGVGDDKVEWEQQALSEHGELYDAVLNAYNVGKEYDPGANPVQIPEAASKKRKEPNEITKPKATKRAKDSESDTLKAALLEVWTIHSPALTHIPATKLSGGTSNFKPSTKTKIALMNEALKGVILKYKPTLAVIDSMLSSSHSKLVTCIKLIFPTVSVPTVSPVDIPTVSLIDEDDDTEIEDNSKTDDEETDDSEGDDDSETDDDKDIEYVSDVGPRVMTKDSSQNDDISVGSEDSDANGDDDEGFTIKREEDDEATDDEMPQAGFQGYDLSPPRVDEVESGFVDLNEQALKMKDKEIKLKDEEIRNLNLDILKLKAAHEKAIKKLTLNLTAKTMEIEALQKELQARDSSKMHAIVQSNLANTIKDLQRVNPYPPFIPPSVVSNPLSMT
jgi:hypothetical protein